MQRPLGNTISTIFVVVGSLAGFVTALTLIAFGHHMDGGLEMLLGGVGAILVLAGGVLAYGLWTMKRWAWDAGVLIELLVLAYGISVNVAVSLDIFGIISMVAAGAVVWYFFQPGVRAAIEQPQVTKSNAKQGQLDRSPCWLRPDDEQIKFRRGLFRGPFWQSLGLNAS